MNRIVSITLRTAVATLIAAPALAQPFGSDIVPEPGRVYGAMGLNPPGMTGAIYNDGTTEAPPPSPAPETR